MAEEIHFIKKICDNCKISQKAMVAAAVANKVRINTVPYNCPVARELIKDCPGYFFSGNIFKLHHTHNIVRR